MAHDKGAKVKKSSVEQILNIAKQLVKNNKNWHFHILTPTFQLNDSSKYALVLENTSDDQSFVCYSDKPYMDIGQKLVELLHGDDVVKTEDQAKPKPPSPQVKELIKRAKELNQQGRFWHHHMLFPDCRFNKHQGKWVIIFEDTEKSEVIESVTSNEPKSDLQHIEGLFYNQKK